MTVSSFNPFTWDNSSAFVISDVLSLALKDHRGETLTVKDSAEDVELKISREPVPEPEKSKKSFFVKRSSEGKMHYHKIDFPYADGNAIRLRVSIMMLLFIQTRKTKSRMCVNKSFLQ